MCFAPKKPDVPEPAPPPEVLEQAAPERPKENQDDTSKLAIGTRKYQSKPRKKSKTASPQLPLRM